MEYLNRSKICREFLNQYSDTLYPELLPKLVKVAIYALHKTFHKWNIKMQELDEFINFFNYKNRNLELESSYHNNCPCPPCQEYLEPKANGIQKLNMGFRPPEEEDDFKDGNGATDCYGYGKFYPNDDVYVNEKNNFYDENYYIPRNHSYRNIQLYHRRLNNPKFITQEKKIYPHWWWNLKDDIEQDDYSEEDSYIDHRPSRLGRFPKDIEDNLKKKAKRFIRNKSSGGTRPIMAPLYDEARIFPNPNLNPTDKTLENSPYPKRYYSPSDEESGRPFGGTGYDGFRRTFPSPITDNNNPNKTDNNINPNYDNPKEINNPPLYATSPNLDCRGPGNPLGRDFGPGTGIDGLRPSNGLGTLGNFGNGKGDQNPQGQLGQGPNNLGMGGPMGMSRSLFGTNALKSQILNKREIKHHTFLSYDQDFNLKGAFKKERGKEKKGLKYSLSGNQLKEDKGGIRRRKNK